MLNHLNDKSRGMQINLCERPKNVQIVFNSFQVYLDNPIAFVYLRSKRI